ncbi:PfkB family carbohydrate kinase, partial [Liquorilactobacillus ghanensis]
MPSPDKILVLGAAFVDVIMKVPSLPVSGEDVTGILQSYEIGGSAFNVFGALKYTNAKADLFVPIGNGPYANMVKKAFASNNLPIMIADSRSDNGWDLCLIEPNGERSFITIQGIEQLWTSSWFDEINLDDYKYFYISGYEIEDDNVSKIILAKLSNRRADSYVLFDSSPRIKYLNSQVIDQLLSRNVLIHCNQSELE